LLHETDGNTTVTVVNRKMKRESKARHSTALRVAKHRENKNVTPEITVQKKEDRRKKRDNTNTSTSTKVEVQSKSVDFDPPVLVEKIDLKSKYKKLKTDLSGKNVNEIYVALKDFIAAEKPLFITPYIDMWNIFATKYSLPTVRGPNDWRENKIRIRVHEKQFDFPEILKVLKESNFHLGDNDRSWRATFDFVIDSQKNYFRILEKKKPDGSDPAK
jgi:hypothetical protein